MLLKVDGINTFYGSFRALRDVSLEVDSGEVVTVLGANGAGKSTLLRTISGLIRSQIGRIVFDGAGPPFAERCMIDGRLRIADI